MKKHILRQLCFAAFLGCFLLMGPSTRAQNNANPEEYSQQIKNLSPDLYNAVMKPEIFSSLSQQALNQLAGISADIPKVKNAIQSVNMHSRLQNWMQANLSNEMMTQLNNTSSIRKRNE